MALALVGQGMAVVGTYVAENVNWAATNTPRADVVAHLLRLDATLHTTHTAAGARIGRPVDCPRGTGPDLSPPEIAGRDRRHGSQPATRHADDGDGGIGAGRTTLLRVLPSLLPRQPGEIRWNGRVVDDSTCSLVPPRAAYTALVLSLFSETLEQNILRGLPEDPGALAAAVRSAVLEDDVQTLKASLDTPVGTRGVKLSGGQVQRAAAARMLVRGAERLVIDDLSSALDVETERPLWERVLTRDNVTCLAVSPRRAASRGPRRRVEGGPGQGRGHAGRLAGQLRGGAIAVTTRRRPRVLLA